jgi:hypothetical protein
MSSFRSFQSCVPAIEISGWIDRIDGFIEEDGLEVVTFACESHLREIHGFSVCFSILVLKFKYQHLLNFLMVLINAVRCAALHSLVAVGFADSVAFVNVFHYAKFQSHLQ